MAFSDVANGPSAKKCDVSIRSTSLTQVQVPFPELKCVNSLYRLQHHDFVLMGENGMPAKQEGACNEHGGAQMTDHGRTPTTVLSNTVAEMITKNPQVSVASLPMETRKGRIRFNLRAVQ